MRQRGAGHPGCLPPGMGDFLFAGWEGLLRTALAALLAYPAMLLFVRISGSRTLAHLNAFDLIVTIALGSTLASVITSRDLALLEGLAAFALLIGMQYAISWSSSRWRRAEDILIGEPLLLVHRGRVLSDALRRARLTESEIDAAARAEGLADLGAVEAMILETNGKLSVVRR